MTATAQSQWPAPPRTSWGAGRIVALILGLVLLLPALGLLVGGGALLLADRSGNRSDGYLFSPRDGFSSDGYAISSERIDLSSGADWLPISSSLGDVRLEVTGTGSSDIFVGIAPVAEATAYLDGVQRTVIQDLGVDAPATARLQEPGGAPAGPPGDQGFWTEQTSGSGLQQLTWTPSDGDWMLVVMNADGSAGVSMQARVGATFPALSGLGWGLLIGGVLAVIVAALLLVLAFRRRTARHSASGAVTPPIPGPRGPSEAPSTWAAPSDGDRLPTVPAAGEDRSGD
jgi:hypothetical protein